MKIIDADWTTDEITKKLINENSCYLSSDKRYWLFTDDIVFYEISDEFQFDEETEDRDYKVYSMNIADWLYEKCDEDELSIRFMDILYDWNRYIPETINTISKLEPYKFFNNNWDKIMLNIMKNEVEIGIANKLKDSLRDMVDQGYDIQVIKDSINK